MKFLTFILSSWKVTPWYNSPDSQLLHRISIMYYGLLVNKNGIKGCLIIDDTIIILTIGTNRNLALLG